MASLPDPRPGLVIGYAYLWHDEAMRGRDEGAKDRPCVIVLAVRKQAGALVVTVAPVTHAPPGNPRLALEIPGPVKRRLGLDDARSWIALHDLNQFVWPGSDLRAVSRTNPDFAYGMLPDNLYRTLRDRIVEIVRAGRIAMTHRRS